MAQAETDVRNLGREFRAVVEVADALERIGSLEQATRDAEGATEAARKVTEEAEMLRRRAEGELAVANEALKVSRYDAEQVVLEAKDDAHTIVRNAEAKARELVSEVTTEAVTLRENIEHDREAHALFMGDVRRQHEQVQEALDAIHIELKAARERIGL